MLLTKLVVTTHSGHYGINKKKKKTHFNLALVKLRDICIVIEEIPSGYVEKETTKIGYF